MKKYHYTYYSYEEFGRGYIGKRSCKCSPEEDVKYFGSYTDKTFKPTQKIILETYNTAEDLAKAEEILHAFYDVAPNPHFANKHNAGEKFSYVMTSEEAKENGKKGGSKCKELGLGVCGQTKDERLKYCIMGGIKQGKITGQINKELKRGFLGMTNEQLKDGKIKGAKKVGKDNKEQSRGIFGLSEEEKNKNRSKGRIAMMNSNLGIFGQTKDELSKNGKKTSSQKWQCTETGFITNAGNLTHYQKARGIDTSNRVRLS
jgi:hypothetical protein